MIFLTLQNAILRFAFLPVRPTSDRRREALALEEILLARRENELRAAVPVVELDAIQ